MYNKCIYILYIIWAAVLDEYLVIDMKIKLFTK